jgi:hypothetical protein
LRSRKDGALELNSFISFISRTDTETFPRERPFRHHSALLYILPPSYN